jgi:hypothetical protein
MLMGDNMDRMGNGSVRNVQLQDLVSASVIKKLEPVMNGLQQGKIDVSDGKKKILEILEPERTQLLEKGVLADYLAWYLAATAAKSGGHLGSISIGRLR